jgi:hypothetical protein
MNELSIAKKVSEEKNDNNANHIRTDEKVQTKKKVLIEIKKVRYLVQSPDIRCNR